LAKPVENKYQRDIIWLVWDGLMATVEKAGNPFIEKLMGSLLTLFCIKYTTGACKKRRYLLYFAVALLTEPVPTHIELVVKKELVANAVEKIGEVYKQIKKNEQSPNTEYLFSNLASDNTFEQSMRRMELVNSLDIFGEKA
jgi:hypothetical protein